MQDEQEIKESIEIGSGENRISDLFATDYSVAVEALLFASPDPLEDREIARIVGCGRREIPSIINELNLKYESWGRSFRIEKYGERYRFYTLAGFDKYISRLAEIPRPVKLSRAALEVLSIIAYRQPTAKAEIERIRGINPDGVLRTLMDKGLVEICGRSDGPGRPLLYGTTRDFLDFFGISNLSELPVPEATGEEKATKGLILKRPPEESYPAPSTDET